MSDLSKDITAANHVALCKHPLPVASYSHVHVNTMERTNRGGPWACCPSASWSWALKRPAALVGPRLFICGWSCLCCGQSERQTLALLRWCVNTPRIFLREHTAAEATREGAGRPHLQRQNQRDISVEFNGLIKTHQTLRHVQIIRHPTLSLLTIFPGYSSDI